MDTTSSSSRTFDILMSSPIYLISFHEKESKSAVSASTYNLFIGPNRIKSLDGFINSNLPDADFLDAISRIPQDATVIVNGLTAMLMDSFSSFLYWAIQRRQRIIFYWHETAWNIRWLADRHSQTFQKLMALLPLTNCIHWCTSSSSKQIVMLLFGANFEQADVVAETIDASDISPRLETHRQSPVIHFVGAGIVDARKGVDIFAELSKSLPRLLSKPSKFYWYSSRAHKTIPNEFGDLGNVEWAGFADNFTEELKKHDVMLMTSRDDPAPLVCLEALATDMPVFAFSTTGYVDILPPDLVAHSISDMQTKIINFCLDRWRYPPGFFRKIAESHSISAFCGKVQSTFGSQANFVTTPPSDKILETDEQQRLRLLNLEMIKQTNMTIVQRNAFIRERESGRALLAELREKVEHAVDQASNSFRAEKDAMNSKLKAASVALKAADDATAIIEKEALAAFRKQIRPRLALDRLPRTICVVGNSPKVLSSELGDRIDDCEAVIRINNFQTKSFEQHVGSKTTLAVVSFAINKNEELEAINKERIFLYPSVAAGDMDRMRERMLHPDIGCGIDPDQLEVLPFSLYTHRLRRFAKLGSEKFPSTGLVAIRLALDLFPRAKIFLHGFSFFEESGERLQHYYGRDTKRDNVHDFEIEADLIRKMVAQGHLETFEPIDRSTEISIWTNGAQRSRL